MPAKNQAAVELGRKGGKPRAKKLTLAQRAEIAREAAAKRWEKKKLVSVRKDVESYESDVIQVSCRALEDKTDVDTGKSRLP